jgi:VanZ like protein
MSFSSRSKPHITSRSRFLHQRPSTLLYCSLALGYSILLFFIANYLPLLTNGAAEILTWAVYSRIIRGIVTFMTAVLGFIVFIRWPLVARRKLFLLQALPFIGATIWFFSRLGESVNEYIHYPQYATCVLLWFAALSRISRNTPDDCAGLLKRLLHRFGPLGLALTISALLGLAEEGFQYLAPRRTFDLQDIALNLMGVWLGGMIVWIVRDSENDVSDPAADGCGPDS